MSKYKKETRLVAVVVIYNIILFAIFVVAFW